MDEQTTTTPETVETSESQANKPTAKNIKFPWTVAIPTLVLLTIASVIGTYLLLKSNDTKSDEPNNNVAEEVEPTITVTEEPEEEIEPTITATPRPKAPTTASSYEIKGVHYLDGSADQFEEYEKDPCRIVVKSTGKTVAECSTNEAEKDTSIHLNVYTIVGFGKQSGGLQYVVSVGAEGGGAWAWFYSINTSTNKWELVDETTWSSALPYKSEECSKHEATLEKQLAKLPDCDDEWETSSESYKANMEKEITLEWKADEMFIKYTGMDFSGYAYTIS